MTHTAKFNINRLTEFEGDDDDTTTPYDAISFVPGMTEERRAHGSQVKSSQVDGRPSGMFFSQIGTRAAGGTRPASDSFKFH